MLSKAKPIIEITLIIIGLLSVLLLFVYLVNWLISLISPRVMDIGCIGIVLFMIWIYAILKTWVEIKTKRRVNINHWSGVLLATIVFFYLYAFINTLDTSQQTGVGILLFVCLLSFIYLKFFQDPGVPDDSDDYHASR